MVCQLSVIVPTFNRPELTYAAVSSVNASRPELVEIIVVDDGSTVPFTHPAPRNSCGIPVRVKHLSTNVGPGMAREAGVADATGRYIAFLDSDDTYFPGWLDSVMAQFPDESESRNPNLLISGRIIGGRPAAFAVRKLLGDVPRSLQMGLSRLCAIFFNPFYTPSVVMHRELCAFKPGLRYCEDYYTNLVALFRANEIVLLDTIACQLGRPPNSAGGSSGARQRMLQGEMAVRSEARSMPFVPLGYRVLVPCGMIYQVVREFLKSCRRAS